jgi:hypothetical protein
MSDGKAAFALKADRDLDSVGAIVINNSESLNVREAIENAPNGVYVTDHPDEIRALDDYEAVKRVAATPHEKPDDGLDELTKAKLLDLPEAAQVEGAKTMNVDDLRSAIRAKRDEGEE